MDEFLDGAHPVALMNIEAREEFTGSPLGRTIGEVVQRLPLWDRPEAFTELMAARPGELMDVLVKWWRRAAQNMTPDEAQEAVRQARNMDAEAAGQEMRGELARRLEAGRLRWENLSDDERRAEWEDLWRQKMARSQERFARSAAYLDLLEELVADERRYMDVLRDDLLAHGPWSAPDS